MRLRRFPRRSLRHWAVCAALAATTASAAHQAAAQTPYPTGVVHPRYVGRSYTIDYGQLVIEVRYVSNTKLQWHQLKGPQAGLKGEEQYGASQVRPGIHFFWWQEKDTSIVTQVVDFEKGSIHTTWTSKEKQLSAFQGRIAAKD